MCLVWSTCSSSYCIQWQKQCNERKLGKGFFFLLSFKSNERIKIIDYILDNQLYL